MKKLLFGILLSLVLVSWFCIHKTQAAVPVTFSNGTVADADDVNADFDYFENKFSTTAGHDHDGSDSKIIQTGSGITSLGNLTGLTVLGDVGIGTTNPEGIFELRASTADTVAVSVIDRVTYHSVGIGNSKPTGILTVGTNPAIPGLFVATTNNVGIGTTNPTSTLTVNGSASFTSFNSGIITANTGTFTTLQFGTTNTFPAGTAPAGQLIMSNGAGVLNWTETIEKRQFFTSSGTFTAPTGVTTVYITLSGGGGSGGGGEDPNDGGGGGAAGVCGIKIPYTVTAGNSYTVTVGVGGAGVAKNTTGNGGGASSFDTVIAVQGGGAGQKSNGATGGAGGTTPTLVTGNASGTTAGARKEMFNGGTAASGTDGGSGVGGGGSGTFFGTGGTGGAGGVAGTAATGYGAGGGGGGSAAASGAGADGFVLVEW